MSRTDDPHPLIKRLRAMGMPEDVIVNRLLLEGWSEDLIRHAFEERVAEPPPQVEKPTVVIQKINEPRREKLSTAPAEALHASEPVPARMLKRNRSFSLSSLSPVALGVVA